MAVKHDSAADLVTTEIRSFTLHSPLNRMPASEKDFIFDEPLVQFSDGADPIFTEYKKVIGATHLTPARRWHWRIAKPRMSFRNAFQ